MSRDAGSFYIRVVDKHGYGVRGATVKCAYGSLSGVGTRYTDRDGWTEFTIVEELIGGGEIRIRAVRINGEQVSSHSFSPKDGETFSFTLP